MKFTIKILKEVDGLEVGMIKTISRFHANELIRNGFAELYDPNNETETKTSKPKKVKK